MTFLDGLTDAERAELYPLFRRETFADGEALFLQGQPSTGGHLIREGAVELTLTLPGGHQLVVARLQAGDFFGEPALLVPGPRYLGAHAVGSTTVDALDHADFQGLRHSYRPVSFKLMMMIARMTAGRLYSAALATGGAAPPEAVEPAPPLGTSESPGCSFDPLPFLPILPFFSWFSPHDHAELLELGTLWELRRGRALLRTGQDSDCCYIVVRGAVEAVNTALGRRVALFGPGAMVGQLAPLLDTRVNADCRMRESGVVLELDDDALAVLLQPTRRLSYRFLNALCLQLFAGLSHANRVLARVENARRRA